MPGVTVQLCVCWLAGKVTVKNTVGPEPMHATQGDKMVGMDQSSEYAVEAASGVVCSALQLALPGPPGSTPPASCGNSFSRSQGSTGLTRCPSHPASRESSRSPS